MEKFTTSAPTRWRRNDISRAAKRFTVGAVITFITLAYFHQLGGLDTLSQWPFSDLPTGGTVEGEGFSWAKLTPETHLSYTKCFEKFECARLEVPMDWNATNADGPKVTLAIIRLPAPVPVTDHRYGGAILTNPGGPGGSGVNFMHRMGADLATIINVPSTKVFDIISWDPRGVNNTLPRISCFPSPYISDLWKFQDEAYGIDSDSPASINAQWARSQALAGCSEVEKGGEILNHINTAPVVADMEYMIEKHAEWRAKEAEKWMASCEGMARMARKNVGKMYNRDAIIERTRWRQGQEKLLYWGFSYGTLLGATFATLLPHRVGRVILDGVVDSTDYYNAGWLSNLQDTDNILTHFYEYCAEAGPSKCAMNIGTTSASEIREQVENLLPKTRDNPFAVQGTDMHGPDIITISDVTNMVWRTLYKPLALFPNMATLFSSLVHGNGSAFAMYKQNMHVPSCPLDTCRPEKEQCTLPTIGETSSAIMCSDALPATQRTKADFITSLETLTNQSMWLGEQWSLIPLRCSHWLGRAKWTLPPSAIGAHDPPTAHPILLIGNTADPVTPLRNAFKMQKQFLGSMVLTEDSDGHCSGSAPSVCSGKYIRGYFHNGELPSEGTVCAVEERPLIGKVDGHDVEDLREGADEVDEDEEMLAALRRIASSIGGGPGYPMGL